MSPLAKHKYDRPHWVYRIFDVDDRLLYVGMTQEPENRMAAWRSRRYDPTNWWDLRARAEWRRYPNHAAALEAEAEAIRTERPLGNVHHNRRKVRAA